MNYNEAPENNGYISSRERLAALERLVVDGKDAEAVMKYADKLREHIENATLEALGEDGVGVEQILEMKYMYKSVNLLCDILLHAIALGRQKEDALIALKNSD